MSELVHHAPFTPFLALCGADVPNQRTTTVRSHVTCLTCQKQYALILDSQEKLRAKDSIRDTRPALTARWRVLERKGWVFELERYGMRSSAQLLGTHAPSGRGYNYMVFSIPMSEQHEEMMCRTYEGLMVDQG